MEKKLPLDFISAVILATGTILGATWRYRVTGTRLIDPFVDRNKGVIYCFWHSDILSLSYIFKGIGVKAVVSSSSDGDRATAIAQRWNHGVIRGSSSFHGISVIRQCVRELKNGQNIVLIPDGPHGPREVIKPGVGHIAMLSGAPVFPVSAFPKRCWRLNSWDRFSIPKPFTSIELKIGEPILPAQFITSSSPAATFTEELQKALKK